MRPRRPEAPFRAASDVRVREVPNHLEDLGLASRFLVRFLRRALRRGEAVVRVLGLAVGDARRHFFVRVRRLWFPIR